MEETIEEVPKPDIEIVGLYSGENDRSCTGHKICGEAVKLGDILRLKNTVVTINGAAEEAVKLVKIDNGMETCTVAFIPRVLARLPKVQMQIGKTVQVVELYKDSGNSQKRLMSHQNKGMASAVFVDLIPQQE
jgi:hypothetical protein